MINVFVRCKQIYDELLNIAQSVEYIASNEDDDIYVDFALDLFNLLINILKVDGKYSKEEIDLINYILDTEITSEDVEAMIKDNEIRDINSFINSLFFKSCMKKDLMSKTIYSRQAIFYLNELCIGISAIDGEISSTEVNFWSKFIGVLEYELNKLNIDKLKLPLKSCFSDIYEEANLTINRGDLDSCLYELNNLIGLDNVKKDVNTMINLIKVRSLRQKSNLPVVSLTFHMVFLGNPGTGKTTVARIIGKIHSALGVLSKGHLVEIDRSGLVGSYVGQTSEKVQGVIEKSLGGILFIDEAYSLVSGRGENDFGYEAIDILLKSMEDKRDDFIVIVAGYPDKMEEFLDSNPGLRSRFNKYIDFKDYTPEELYMIFERLCGKNGFTISEDLKNKVMSYFDNYVKDETFANGRTVRNVFEKIVQNQANRIINIPNIKQEDLQALIVDDFQEK